MPNLHLAVILAGLCAAGPALAADRAVHLVVPPPVRQDIAALPEIADPVDDAERRINTALKRLDQNVLKAAAACKGDDWQRTVIATMRGPGFLSLTVTDTYSCEGMPHPEDGTWSIVYDLGSGRPVDWTKLLPASLTGKVALEQQADGTKVVTLASKRLFELYMAGYSAGGASGSDLDECKQAVEAKASDGPPGMMVWLDAKGGGLAVQVGLEHAMAPCEEAVVIKAAALKAEGAQVGLLRVFAGAP